MPHSQDLVLLTGASGFLGSHVLEQLLKEGHRVRAVARSTKVQGIRDAYQHYGNAIEVVTVDDVVTGDFALALKDVTAVIHVASPLLGRGDTHTVLNGAIRGTRNVLEQALTVGVKKIIVTSSSSALNHPGKPKLAPETYTAEDWNTATEGEALASTNAAFVYFVSKGVAERAVWELAEEHKDADFTTLLFPFLFGRFPAGLSILPGNTTAMSSNELIYSLLNGNRAPLGFKEVDAIDVQDVARAHVLALSAPPASEVGRKRLLLYGGSFSWADAIAHLRMARPTIVDRLPQLQVDSEPRPRAAEWDIQRGKELLGIEQLKSWQSFLEDAVDGILALEEEWSAEGWKPTRE